MPRLIELAEGYASSMMTLKDGRIKTGRILKAKSNTQMVVLVDSDGTDGGATFQSIARLAGEGVSIGDVLTVITDFEGNSVTVDAS